MLSSALKSSPADHGMHPAPLCFVLQRWSSKVRVAPPSSRTPLFGSGESRRLTKQHPNFACGSRDVAVVVGPSEYGEGVLFRQTLKDSGGRDLPFKTPDTPTLTPTLCPVSSRKNEDSYRKTARPSISGCLTPPQDTTPAESPDEAPTACTAWSGDHIGESDPGEWGRSAG